MPTPPLPPGDANRPADAPPPPPDAIPAASAADAGGPSTVIRPPAAPTDAAAPASEDVLADLFSGDEPKIADDSPTVISKNRPSPPPETGITESLRGRRLAHFELIEPIGIGGMAAVLRARDTQLDRTVALKVLPPEMADDAENVRRFHQEARSAAKLDHENIARVFYCGEDQTLHFIAFEFVEGENLRTILERRGRLPVQEALHYMLQIAAGLAHAAARGVVHRDIKPSNIIISPNGRAKLVDMGLARMEGVHTDKGLTQSGVTLGTFDYISPEQALEPRDADVRSDIYSLGCTFYHVLTGVPPVPEGTAAKKLHHHQHEAPVDPRQLNPEISDTVAAILARMMAKDPKARYQRAEHLVQHLLLAAQALDPADAPKPEGVLYVDTPLPAPPHTRPLLVAGLAAMILLVIILFFGRSNRPPEWTDLVPPQRDAGPTRKDQPAQGKDAVPNNGQPDPPRPRARGTEKPREAATARDLLDIARESRPDDAALDIILTGPSYQFTLGPNDDGASSPTLKGRRVTIRAKDPSKKPILSFRNDTQQIGLFGPALRSSWLGLVIDSDEALIENVRFILDVHGGGDGRMAAVVLRGHDKPDPASEGFTFRHCEFIQAGQRTDSRTDRPSSIVLNAANRSARAALTLEDCYLVGCEEVTGDLLKNVKRGGQDAIALRSPARVRATNCAFGPHAAVFRIEPGAEGSDLALSFCAGLLYDEAAAFHLAGKETACSIAMHHCWWAGLNKGLQNGKGAVLLRQEGLGERAVTYQGKDNRFLGLDAFWVRPTAADPSVADKLPEFQKLVKTEDSPDLPASAKFFKASDPLALLEHGEPGKAFELNERLPLARAADSKRLVGLLHWGTTRYKPISEQDAAVAGRRVLIVDPDAKGEELTYKTLNGALAETKAEEEVDIQLRFNGPHAMTPAVVDKRIKARIRPAPDCRPIVQVEKPRDVHSHLLRILEGEVTFEDLEFRLQPDDANLKSQSIAELVGEGKCTFRKCIVTLDSPGKVVPVAAASVSDPEKVQMVMPPVPAAGKGPRLTFENCIVRGDGDLIVSHATRPFEAELTNVWAALSGVLLNSDGSREENAPPAEQPTALRLKQVTAYLAGHLIRLRAERDFKGVTPLDVDARKSVFQAASSAKALIHLEGPAPSEERLKTLIDWKADANVYGGFDNLLDNQPFDDGMPAPPITSTPWAQRETNQRRGKEVLTALRPSTPLAQALPEHFEVKTDLRAGQGAALDALPRLRAETKSDE